MDEVKKFKSFDRDPRRTREREKHGRSVARLIRIRRKEAILNLALSTVRAMAISHPSRRTSSLPLALAFAATYKPDDHYRVINFDERVIVTGHRSGGEPLRPSRGHVGKVTVPRGRGPRSLEINRPPLEDPPVRNFPSRLE